ncbi:MAG: GeoRSP system radical SAM/SPASM protein [Bdellovibrio sp.]
MSKHDPLPPIGILQEMREQAFKDCLPINATVEITMSCNFACKHCYNFDRSGPMPKDFKESSLSKSEIINILKDLIDNGAFFINLTGGEALLHPNLDEFIDVIVKKQAIARLKTNAALVDAERAAHLRDLGLQGADITLYGMSDDSYSKFTGKNQFHQSRDGIMHLKDAGLDVHVNFIVHKYALSELDTFLNWVRSENISFSISDEITERYDQSSGAHDVRISEDELALLLRGPHRQFFDANNSERALQCSCARSVVAVSVTGKVYPCIGAPIVSGDLRKQNFKDIWQSSSVFLQIRNLKETDFKNCSSCDVIEFCSRSSGAIYCDTGNYTGCSDRTLKSAQLRALNKIYR